MNQPIAVPRSNAVPGSVHPITVKSRYTKSKDTTGWLRVSLEPTGEAAYLCEFVNVAISVEGERTHFTILEGRYKGRQASLGEKNSAQCLIAAKRGSGAKLVAKVGKRQWLESRPRNNQRLNQLVSTLQFDGHSAMITLDSDVAYIEENRMSPDYKKKLQSKPLPKGTYNILTPESAAPQRNTNFYVTAPGGNPDLKYDTVWFPIEYAATSNSNFIHVGNLSEGCVTMYDLTMWNPLYQYLISNRSDQGGKYVGTISIV